MDNGLVTIHLGRGFDAIHVVSKFAAPVGGDGWFKIAETPMMMADRGYLQEFVLRRGQVPNAR